MATITDGNGFSMDVDDDVIESLIKEGLVVSRQNRITGETIDQITDLGRRELAKYLEEHPKGGML